jgi:copper(I)-binding protein
VRQSRADRLRVATMLATAGLLMGVGLALGAEPSIAVEEPWLRFIIAARPAAAYLTLSNNTDHVVTLTGASSPGCSSLMLHQSVAEGGQQTMVMVDSIDVPAHGSISFSPGGYHLMCMDPTATTRPGASVPVTLTFADGETVSASFPVRNATGG